VNQIADVGTRQNQNLKLISHEIIFEVFQPMWSRYLNVADGQGDRGTDRQTTYRGITALCVALRGKNTVEAVW